MEGERESNKIENLKQENQDGVQLLEDIRIYPNFYHYVLQHSPTALFPRSHVLTNPNTYNEL